MRCRFPLIVLLVAGCGSNPADSLDTPHNIAFTLPVSEIKVGDELQLTAVARNGVDAPLPAISLAWSTDLPALATISPTGRLRALAPGTVVITVGSAGVVTSRTLIIRPVVPFSIGITPQLATLTAGLSTQLVADVRAADGYSLINASVSWSVDRPAVATVSSTGLLSALSAGVVTVTAVSGPAQRSFVLSVSPAVPEFITISGGRRLLQVDGTTDLLVTVRTGTGVLIPNPEVEWSSSNPSVATVSTTGRVSALTPGVALVRARSGTVSSDVSISVLGLESPVHRLAFIRTTGGISTIETMSESGVLLTSMRPSVPLRAAGPMWGPTASLSPDGATVAYDCPLGVCEIDISTGESRHILSSGLSEPQYHDHGHSIFMRVEYGSVGLYDRVTESLVTRRAPFYVAWPRISPDGQSVLYNCDFTRQYDALASLCRMNADGSETLYKSYAFAHSWSPDGRIAYIRDTDWIPTHRYLVVEPMQQQPNPNGPGVMEFGGFDDVTETAWSPDGLKLAMVRSGTLWVFSLAQPGTSTRLGDFPPGSVISSISWR